MTESLYFLFMQGAIGLTDGFDFSAHVGWCYTEKFGGNQICAAKDVSQDAKNSYCALHALSTCQSVCFDCGYIEEERAREEEQREREKERERKNKREGRTKTDRESQAERELVWMGVWPPMIVILLIFFLIARDDAAKRARAAAAASAAAAAASAAAAAAARQSGGGGRGRARLQSPDARQRGGGGRVKG
jgi:hypothetical protein